jgi:hypothetical protein
MHSALFLDLLVFARLIDAGANLTLKSHSGETPLDFARSKHASKIVAMIEAKLKE